jgi:hypothetical protein
MAVNLSELVRKAHEESSLKGVALKSYIRSKYPQSRLVNQGTLDNYCHKVKSIKTNGKRAVQVKASIPAESAKIWKSPDFSSDGDAFPGWQVTCGGGLQDDTGNEVKKTVAAPGTLQYAIALLVPIVGKDQAKAVCNQIIDGI